MKRIIRKLKILEVSGCDKPAQEPARVAIMKRDDPSATPMTDRLADRIDDYKRIFPHLADEDHYSMAWRDLSLGDRAKVRDEASGAYQERLAQEERYRELSMRAERRGEGKQTMKHEVGILLKALHGVFADEALTPRERGEVVADVLDDYADRTGGRDGLKDIASIPAARTATLHDLTKADTRHALAMTILEGKAEALRKSDPSLSKSQAFAKVYTDRANAELAKIERAANEARFAEQAAFSYTGDNMQADLAIAKRDNAIVELRGLAEELAQAGPRPDAEPGFREGLHGPSQRQTGQRRAAVRT